jgi:hypothetical protein
MQRSKSTLMSTLTFIKDSGREMERRVMMSRAKNRGISVASKDARERESVRSSSKIRLLQPSASKMSARQPSTKHPERHIRTVASTTEDSISYCKRVETENSPLRKRAGTICSLFL